MLSSMPTDDIVMKRLGTTESSDLSLVNIENLANFQTETIHCSHQILPPFTSSRASSKLMALNFHFSSTG